MNFFSNPNKIWLAYLAVLAVLATALGWFSWTTIKLDSQVELNRQQIQLAQKQAVLQERISYGLWRMDWMLTPLVAQEAARSYWMYEPLIELRQEDHPHIEKRQQRSSESNPELSPSPLIMHSSPFVKLHFQIDEQNRFSSPQVPRGEALQFACSTGLTTTQEVDKNAELLRTVASEVQFETLLSACSAQNVPDSEPSDLTWLLESSNPIAPTPSGFDETNSQRANWIDNRAEESLHANQLRDSGEYSAKSTKLGDFGSRAAAANQFAAGQRAYNVQQQISQQVEELPRQVVEGAMRAIWFDDHLLLARRVLRNNQSLIQCCWLDWDLIKKELLSEIGDTLPNVELLPRRKDSTDFNRALATLPVDLVCPPDEINGTTTKVSQASFFTGLIPSRTACQSLAIAWGGFLLSALSMAWLIFGVTKLSERRATFASAVTHELRTPLTTFRLYSEMLDTNMIADEAQKKSYTRGLVVEADRLCRLVDNVLQFARLEKKQVAVRSETITTADLMNRVLERCEPRANLAGMKLQTQFDEELQQRSLETSTDTVEQIIFNLIDNACKYASNSRPPNILLTAHVEKQSLVISVLDYGPGIDPKMVRRLFRPFSRSSDETAGTAAGVGLGLSLARQLAKQIGGKLQFVPVERGCQFELKLKLKA